MAGIPNIEGSVGNYYTALEEKDGCFANTKIVSKGSGWMTNATNTSYIPIIFDASLSNPIYGNSSTVTPLSLSSTFIIKY